MPRLADLLARDRQLALAVRTKSPGRLAETFAAYAGVFYDRAAFDLLAREVQTLYAVADERDGAAFQRTLDARLERRMREPVQWQTAPHVGRSRP